MVMPRANVVTCLAETRGKFTRCGANCHEMAEEYVLPSRRKRGHGRRARTSRGRRVTNEERIDKKNGWFHRKNMLAEMLGSKHNIVGE